MLNKVCKADRHGIPGRSQPSGRYTLRAKHFKRHPIAWKPATHSGVAVSKGFGIPVGGDHYLPPLELLIGVVRTSPNHTQFGCLIIRVPKSTGMGLSVAAIGASTSPGFGVVDFGRGARSEVSTVVMTQTTSCCHIARPQTSASPAKGFLTGIYGKPPKFRWLLNFAVQVARV